MRGDGVDIGHVGEVQGNAGGIGDAAGSGDASEANRKHDAGVLRRRGWPQRAFVWCSLSVCHYPGLRIHRRGCNIRNSHMRGPMHGYRGCGYL